MCELRRGPNYRRSRKFSDKTHAGHFVGYHPTKLGYLIETDGHAGPVCRHDVYFIEDFDNAGDLLPELAEQVEPEWLSEDPPEVVYPFDLEPLENVLHSIPETLEDSPDQKEEQTSWTTKTSAQSRQEPLVVDAPEAE